jgi:putative ATP-dependent endonuclease of the OLD family
MKLKKIKLKDFRAYREEVVLNLEDGLTAFIGKNDIGKSAILEALEIFFNNKTVKIDNDDFNVDSGDDAIVMIACIFKDIPSELVIDETNETSLDQECLLNEDGDLELVKEFKKGAKSPSETAYIRANFPKNKEYKGILDKTQKELQTLAKDLQVEDLRKNADLRKAIRENIQDIQYEMQLIPVKKGDGKNIWEKINVELPMFALFKSDRASTDQDREVQDPMKLAVDIALKEAEAKLNAIKDQVQTQALEVANRTISKLKEMNKELAEEFFPKFKEEPKWNGIFKLDLSSRNNIPINKRGSGVRRLILLNFFRAEAERLRDEKHVPDIIFALEEPETSQHPSNQEMIINALLEISDSGKSQVLLTTHVPALAALLPLDSVRFLNKNNENAQCEINEPSEEVFSLIADSLGILPYDDVSTANALVLVEGYLDVIFLNHLMTTLKEGRHIDKDMNDLGIVPLIAGGCGNLKHWINLKLLESLGKPFLCFMDSDKSSDTDPEGGEKNQKSIEEFRKKGINLVLTRKKEVENYLCPSLIPNIEKIGDYDDVKKMANDKKILEKKWHQMTADKILERSKYSIDGKDKYELLELSQMILALTNSN